MKNRYSFDKVKHIHTLDGKPLTGITTVLSVISKPALIQWAADQAVRYLQENVITKGTETSIVRNGAFEEARTAHRKKKEAAGDWGTRLHSWVESYINSTITNQKTPIPLEGLLGESCRHFVTWAQVNRVKFLESEKNLYSEKHWLGGITDIICEIDGKIWIADIKTSSAIYPENFWQMAAYGLMIEEMGLYKDMVGQIVLNLRKDGTFEEKRSASNEDNLKAFMACLTIYRIKEKINKQIIK